MEVNPRAVSSFACDIGAGADFPYHYWLLAGGASLPIEYDYEVGFGTHRLFGEFQYLMSVLREDYPNIERPTLRKAIVTFYCPVITNHTSTISRLTIPGRSFVVFISRYSMRV